MDYHTQYTSTLPRNNTLNNKQRFERIESHTASVWMPILFHVQRAIEGLETGYQCTVSMKQFQFIIVI